MSDVKQIIDDLNPSMQLRAATIPRAFIEHNKIKYILHHIIDGFNHEEQQAIIYFYFSELSIKDIAKATYLTEDYVLSVINLYLQRLESKINFFKRFVLYDVNDLLSVEDMFLQEDP